MNILFQLSILFAKLSAFAFGGGYVIISSLIQESEARGWATGAELANIIALAGMTPGPVAMNAAVAYGYKVAGFPGAVASLLGIAVPCAVIVIVAARFFFKVYKHPVVTGALYGLRPTITGIIAYAAANLALKNGIIGATSKTVIGKGLNVSASGVFLDKGFNIPVQAANLFELKSIAMAAVVFVILAKTKIHPVFIILASGVAGLALF